MVSFSMKTRVRPDGKLRVDVSIGLPESDVDVLVVVRPIANHSEAASPTGSWPKGFFDRTFGCLAEDPIFRGPNLQQESREKLL